MRVRGGRHLIGDAAAEPARGAMAPGPGDRPAVRRRAAPTVAGAEPLGVSALAGGALSMIGAGLKRYALRAKWAALTLLLFVLMPAAGLAQTSVGCAAVNNGGLNQTTTFVNGVVTASTISGAVGNDGGTASINSSTWSLGDTINYTVTTAGDTTAEVGYRQPPNPSQDPQGFVTSGSYSITLPAGVTKMFSYAVLTVGNGSGTATVAASCTPGAVAPTVTGVSPTSGPTGGGTTVTITGTGFTGATAVKFGANNAASYAVNSNTQITATSPAGTAGAVDIAVTNNSLTSSTSSADQFTYVAAPTVSSISPTSGPAAGGTSVRITGTGFTGATGAASVKFGSSNAASYTVNSNTQITAISPAGTGAAHVTVTNNSATSATSSADRFAYVALATPTLSASASSASPLFGVPFTLTATLSGATSPTGTVTFRDGAAVLASAPLSGLTATFTTKSLSVGAHSIVAAYSGDAHNAAATSSPVSVNVGARPNPALNPDVIGLTAAEVAIATRFGQSQIDNAFHRLEQIHDEDDEDSAPRKSAQSEGRGAGQTVGQTAGQSGGETAALNGAGAAGDNADGKLVATGSAAANRALSQQDSLGAIFAPGQTIPYAQAMPDTRPDSVDAAGHAINMVAAGLPAAMEALNSGAGPPFHIWSSGSISFGGLNGDGAYDNRFITSGLTIGVDRKFAPALTAGLAFGAGLDHTAVGTDGTKSDATAFNATLYADYRILPHTFLDVIGGYGAVRFDLQRWSGDGNVMLAGARGGSDAFGSFGLTQDARWGDWKISPYGRIDVVRVDLGAYSETGSDIWALSYANLYATTVSGVVGARIAYPIAMAWGALTPMARIEYNHAFDGAYNQNLGYADIPGLASYSLAGTALSRDLLTGGLTLRAENADQFSAEIEYLLTEAARQIEGQEIRLSVRQAF